MTFGLVRPGASPLRVALTCATLARSPKHSQDQTWRRHLQSEWQQQTPEDVVHSLPTLGGGPPSMEPGRDGVQHDVTELLQRVRVGDPRSTSELISLIYRQLHAIAVRHMRDERQDITIQPTVLVHEAFLQLAGTDKIDWQNRAHFFALSSRAMRRILVDHAREVNAQKRPGAHQQVELDAELPVPEKNVDLLALNEALD